MIPGGALPSTPNTSHCGDAVTNHPGAFLLSYPLRPDSTLDLQNYTTLLSHAHATLNCTLGQHPILLTENFPNYATRSALSESLFESHSAPALFYANSSVLTLYAQGLTTGGVLLLGDSRSCFTPVYQGLGLPTSSLSSGLAGHACTRHCIDLLRRSHGLHLVTTAEYEIARRIKHDVAMVDAKQPKTYMLPDGQTVEVGKAVRQGIVDPLFDGGEVGSEDLTATSLVAQGIMSVDQDLRKTMWEGLHLVGGCAACPGVGERLVKGLRERAPRHARIKVSRPKDLTGQVFVGGSILASLSAMKGMWVDKKEWEEVGEGCVRRRMLV